MIHPISFCIPESKIVPRVPLKTKLYGHVIPWNLDTYIFQDEKSYYDDYAQSVFGLTCRKGGWDCLRHYEILANGCIPWFENLDACPVNTMTHFPKQIVQEAMVALEGTNCCNSSLVYAYSTILLDYTRRQLTTKSMAAYVLKQSNKEHTKSMLYLSGDTSPDYLRCLMLHGFKELFGSNCEDFISVPHIYTDYPEDQVSKLYGKGISYTRLIKKSGCVDEKEVEKNICDHKYDVVIYGSIHRRPPYWDLVHKYYSANDIILICGEDYSTCDLRYLGNDHNLFIRELG